MRYIAKLNQSLTSIPTIERVLIAIAFFLLCAPFAQIQNLFPQSSEVESARMQDARQLIDDLQSSDNATLLAACNRADSVHQALINSAAWSSKNKVCMFEMDTRVIESMYNLTMDANTREEKIAALTVWGNISNHGRVQNGLVEEALNSDDLVLLKLAIPLATIDIANQDPTLTRLIELARVPECQLAVLQRLRQDLQTKGDNWGYPPEEVVSLVRHLEGSMNLEIGLEAKAFLKLLTEQNSVATSTSATNRARLDYLSNMENLLNGLANFTEALGLLWGVPTVLMGCMSLPLDRKAGIRTMLFGSSCVLGGLATPYCFNWLFISAHDANNCF